MQATEFEGVPAWPDSKTISDGRDARHDNQPPLQERVLLDFEEDLATLGIKRRIQELLDSAAKCPEKIESQDVAGKAGDLVKLARNVEKAIDDAREKHNRPLIDARTALKSKADGAFAPLANAIASVRARLNAFMQEEARKAEEQRRANEEAARAAAAEAAKAAAESDAPAPQIEVAPVEVARPVARGDLGAKVGTVTVWHHEIESVRQLPDRLLKHPKVIDALNIVIAAEIRGMGERKSDIKGVRIWSSQEARVR